MTTFVQQPTTITAEQWTGSDDSLRRIQQLMFPFSPFRTSHIWPELAKNLGVPVVVAGNSVRLEFVDPGGWFVKGVGGRFTIYTDQEFRELFVAQPSDMELDEQQAQRESLRNA